MLFDRSLRALRPARSKPHTSIGVRLEAPTQRETGWPLVYSTTSLSTVDLCPVHQFGIFVSDGADGSVGFQEWLMRFHGHKLNFPQRQTYYPSENYTRWHVREVFQGDYRER